MERDAAVELVLVIPAPGTFPRCAGIDTQRVEHHRQRGQATEGRLILRSKLAMKTAVWQI